MDAAQLSAMREWIDPVIHQVCLTPVALSSFEQMAVKFSQNNSHTVTNPQRIIQLCSQTSECFTVFQLTTFMNWFSFIDQWFFFGSKGHFIQPSAKQQMKLVASRWKYLSTQQVKNQVFPSGAGGDQSRAKRRVNVAPEFPGWHKTTFQRMH